MSDWDNMRAINTAIKDEAHSGKYDGWSYVGKGFFWLLFLVGLGGCWAIFEHDSKTPLIKIEITQPKETK